MSKNKSLGCSKRADPAPAALDGASGWPGLRSPQGPQPGGSEAGGPTERRRSEAAPRGRSESVRAKAPGRRGEKNAALVVVFLHLFFSNKSSRLCCFMSVLLLFFFWILLLLLLLLLCIFFLRVGVVKFWSCSKRKGSSQLCKRAAPSSLQRESSWLSDKGMAVGIPFRLKGHLILPSSRHPPFDSLLVPSVRTVGRQQNTHFALVFSVQTQVISLVLRGVCWLLAYCHETAPCSNKNTKGRHRRCPLSTQGNDLWIFWSIYRGTCIDSWISDAPTCPLLDGFFLL